MKSFELQLEQISKLSETAMKDAQSRWDHGAKPLHSLGLLEDALVRIAGIQGTSQIDLTKRALVIICADNGVVEEGVTQTGQDVTAVGTRNFTAGDSQKSPFWNPEFCQRTGNDQGRGAEGFTGGNRAGERVKRTGLSSDRPWGNGNRQYYHIQRRCLCDLRIRAGADDRTRGRTF